jgi:ribose transport system permease protein
MKDSGKIASRSGTSRLPMGLSMIFGRRKISASGTPSAAESPWTRKADGRRTAGWSSTVLRLLSVHGLLVLLLVLIGGFSLLRPDTFPTTVNFQAITSARAVVALLALAVMIPLAANEFDLSVGYVVGLGHILVVGLQVRLHLPWELAALLVVLAGAGIGAINGLLITQFRISSFIATLGIGTFVYGISQWYTGGEQIVGRKFPGGFLLLSENIGPVPFGLVLVLAVALALWITFEHMVPGRFLYVIGSNQRAADLTGIPSARYKLLAFVASGTLTGIAGVVLGSELRVGQSTVGADFLLPAFAGALLGATSVRPGRVNVWGTLLAVSVLAVAVSGLQHLGADFYVEPLFNGVMLVLAVGLAEYARRRRERQTGVRRNGESERCDKNPTR